MFDADRQSCFRICPNGNRIIVTARDKNKIIMSLEFLHAPILDLEVGLALKPGDRVSQDLDVIFQVGKTAQSNVSRRLLGVIDCQQSLLLKINDDVRTLYIGDGSSDT